MKESEIPISEIFVTLQGEGPHAGKPALFIRVGGCNLACPTCDAWYTVPRLLKLRGEKPQWTNLETEEVLIEIEELLAKHPMVKHIVISGGEPLIYQEKLLKLIGMLKDTNLYNYAEIEWETNGTYIPTSGIDAVTNYYDVSPKLMTFGGVDVSERIVPKVLQWFNNSDKAIFKWVVCNDIDVGELLDIVVPLNLDNDKIWVMPEGDTEERIAQTGRICAEACKKYGWKLSWRLQTPLWGTARGT